MYGDEVRCIVLLRGGGSPQTDSDSRDRVWAKKPTVKERQFGQLLSFSFSFNELFIEAMKGVDEDDARRRRTRNTHAKDTADEGHSR